MNDNKNSNYDTGNEFESGIEKGRELFEVQVDFIVELIIRWIEKQLGKAETKRYDSDAFLDSVAIEIITNSSGVGWSGCPLTPVTRVRIR